MRRLIARFVNRVRGSLFYVPAAFVVLSLLLGLVASNVPDIPPFGSPSPDSARVILTTIASATITVAGIVFSITLVSLQLAATQYSSRVLRGFLRDGFSKLVIGLVIGTFTYSLVVLAIIPEPSGSGVAVTIAVLLAVVAVLAIIAFIDRTANSVQASQTIQRIARETRERIHELLPYPAGQAPAPSLTETGLPEGESYTVRSTRDGWVQGVHEQTLAAAVDADSVIRVDVRVGTLVVDRTPLCTVWPVPEDGDAAAARARRAFTVGRERSAWEDISFGLLQLIDVALRALTDNDPTTAGDALGGIGGVLSDLLHRDLPPRVRNLDGRRIYRPHDLAATAYVDLAFEQIRVAGASQPEVCIELLSALARLHEKLVASELSERTAPLRRQAQLVVDSAHQACRLPEDRERVRQAAEDLGLVE